MRDIALLYRVISTILFITSLSSIAKDHRDAFSFFSAYIENPIHILLTMNFILCFTILSAARTLKHFAAFMQLELLDESIFSVSLVVIIFIYYYNDLAIDVGDEWLEYSFLPIAFSIVVKFMSLTLKKIQLMSSSPSSPARKQASLIAMAFFLLFLGIFQLLSTISSLSINSNMISFFIVYIYNRSLIDIVEALFIHFKFIFDANDDFFGRNSWQKIARLQVIFAIIRHIAAAVLLLISISAEGSVNAMAKIIIADLNGHYKTILSYFKWTHFSKKVGSDLPKPSPEDIQNEDVCVICRETMTTEDSRKLSCGHCFHVDCIEQWTLHQLKCPICQVEIKVDGKKQDPNGIVNNIANAQAPISKKKEISPENEEISLTEMEKMMTEMEGEMQILKERQLSEKQVEEFQKMEETMDDMRRSLLEGHRVHSAVAAKVRKETAN